MNWIKCSDRRPPNGIYVLGALWDGRPKVKMYFVLVTCRHNSQWEYGGNGDIIDPKKGIITHWMNLPDPPEKEGLD